MIIVQLSHCSVYDNSYLLPLILFRLDESLSLKKFGLSDAYLATLASEGSECHLLHKHAC